MRDTGGVFTRAVVTRVPNKSFLLCQMKARAWRIPVDGDHWVTSRVTRGPPRMEKASKMGLVYSADCSKGSS